MPGLLRGTIRGFSLLTPAERVRAALLVLSMNVNALLGLVGLAGVLPFVHLMLVPDPLVGDGMMARALRVAGIPDVNAAIFVVGVGLVLLVVAKNLYALVHSGWQNRFCAAAEVRIATQLLDAVVRAPYVWLMRRNSSVLRDVIAGSSIEWSRGVIRTALQIVNDALFLLVAFGLLIATSPLAGLVVLVLAVVLAGLLMRLAQPRIAGYGERKRKAIQLAGVTATEAVVGGRDVRLSGAGPTMVAAFARDMGTYSSAEAAGRQWQQLPRFGIEVVGLGALVGVALGALWAGMPRADVAALLALFAVIAVRAIPVVSQVVNGFTSLAGSMPAAAELLKLLDELTAPEVTDRLGPLPDWSKLALEDVSFAYPGSDRAALGPISLELVRGRSYGIVGLSGAGKSTLVDLLVGLLPPATGQVLLDGLSLDGERLARWRHNVAYVVQAPFLIDASLEENIEFGQPAHPDRAQRLHDVVAAAGLAEVVRGLPDGLATRLGERGAYLSGGQRQRVAIARALYRAADLIVLDEATSALDSVTEREITEALAALKGRVTLVVIAHRLATLADCDELIVLEAGRMVGRGAHAQLIQKNQPYSRLVEAQSWN